MQWPPRLEFGICDRLVARFAPREENAAYLYFVHSARLKRFGLRDTVLLGCCIGALAGLLNAGFCIIVAYLALGYLAILMSPVRNLVRNLRSSGQGPDLLTAPISSSEFVAAVRAHLNLSLGTAGIVGVSVLAVALLRLAVQSQGMRTNTLMVLAFVLLVVVGCAAVLSRLFVWCMVLGQAWTAAAIVGTMAAVLGIRFAEYLAPTSRLEWLTVGTYAALVIAGAAGLCRLASRRCERVFVRRVCDQLFP